MGKEKSDFFFIYKTFRGIKQGQREDQFKLEFLSKEQRGSSVS